MQIVTTDHCTTRHDLIVKLLASICRLAGAVVFIEPKYSDGKRVDAQVYFATDTTALDVRVTHPASPSYCIATKIALTPLGAARDSERKKHTKYDSQAKGEGASFNPFVLESFGGFGREATLFLHKIARSFCENSPFPVNKDAFLKRTIRQIGVLLQRGNAYVQLAGCIAARDAAGRKVGYY